MMNVVYYVACSLDGCIATTEGGVEWLEPFQGSGEDYGFGEMYSSVDSLLLGSHTYEFALAHPPWMSPDKPSWVFTSRDLPVAHPSITLTSREPVEVLEEMGRQGLVSAWLMGGGRLAASFRRQQLISRYVIAVMPVLLGVGIPLLAHGGDLERIELAAIRRYDSGVVQLTYEASPKARGEV